MDKLLQLVFTLEITEILKGVMPDISNFSEEKLRVIAIVLLHCCLNGPVSVNKATNFPLVKEKMSITGILGEKVSNSSWRALAYDFATAFIKNENANQYIESCQQVSIFKAIWPLADPKLYDAAQKKREQQ